IRPTSTSLPPAVTATARTTGSALLSPRSVTISCAVQLAGRKTAGGKNEIRHVLRAAIAAALRDLFDITRSFRSAPGARLQAVPPVFSGEDQEVPRLNGTEERRKRPPVPCSDQASNSPR